MSPPRAKPQIVSWDQLHRDARALAAALEPRGPFRAIVCVTRGGMVPAAIVARELGLRVVETISVASYDHQAQGAPEVLKGVAPELSRAGGAGVLVIDDLADSGATARVVRGLLPQAHFAALYAKPQGRPLLDTFVRDVSQDTWIYFPWDLDLAYAPPLGKGAAG